VDTLYLVSCVSVKLGHAAFARELYCSPWFKAARRYVESNGGRWRILSAKHGAIHPDTVIEPYEETLNTKTRTERAEWALRVLEQIPTADRYVLLAGKRYAEFLAAALNAELPLKGLGIGQQLTWFKSH
jgi:hypothetical protein